MASPEHDLEARLAAYCEAVRAIARGEETGDDPDELAEQVLSAARASQTFDPYDLATTPANLLAENLRRLRMEAGVRQEQLASLMMQLGFAWKRQTVAEVERITDPDDPDARAPRRLTHEEMFALCALYGVPMVEMWRCPPGVTIELDAPGLNALTGRQMSELIVGRRGQVGEGGPTWSAAAAVIAPGTVERPARQLWRTRKANETKGGR